MRLLVTGAHGQLGRTIARRARAAGHEVVATGRAELDLTRGGELAARLAAVGPAAVINAAAYTAVDRAEAEPAAAFAVNAESAGALAAACAARAIALVHVSSDHVFDGRAARPYREDDPPAPLGVYGASKLAGERAVVAAGGVVVRTSWLFADGGWGFVPTILARVRAGQPLRVVADRHGRPTWADDLADALLALAARPPAPGVLHFAGAGATTWHGLATALAAEVARHLAIAPPAIEPIAARDWPAVAPRPAYAVLDTARIEALGIAPPPWRVGLAALVARALGPANG